MTNASNKKDDDLRTFMEALSLARANGGEGRRNADRLAGIVNHNWERPDLSVSTPDGRLVGIEHFRVDQLIKHDKQVQSAAAEFIGYTEKRRKEVVAGTEPGEVTNEMIGCFGEVLGKAATLVGNSCLDDLTKSLNARLFGEHGHALKIAQYRENLDHTAGGRKIQMGYLIEFHSDFSGLFLNSPKGARRVKPGETPLFSDVFDLLKSAACDVDWMVLAFCGSLDGSMQDAAVIRCANGMFKKSAERQGLFRTEYLGFGKNEPRRSCTSPCTVSAEQNGDEIAYSIEKGPGNLDPNKIWDEATHGAARAISLAQSGSAFTATPSVQMAYEIVRDYARTIGGNPNAVTVSELLRGMGPHEAMLRIERFDQKWNIQKGNSSTAEFGHCTMKDK